MCDTNLWRYLKINMGYQALKVGLGVLYITIEIDSRYLDRSSKKLINQESIMYRSKSFYPNFRFSIVNG